MKQKVYSLLYRTFAINAPVIFIVYNYIFMRNAFQNKSVREFRQGVNDSKCKFWLQTLLDNTLMSIMALKAIRDKKGTIIDFEYMFVSKIAEASVNRTDHTSRYFLKEFPGAKIPGLFDHCVKVTETGIPWNSEIFDEAEGFKSWTTIKTIKLEDGCLIMYSDITERKNAEHEIRKMKEELAKRATDKYQKFFNSVNEGFCLMEAEFEDHKVVDLIFREVNPAFEKNTGLHDVVNKPVSQVLPSFKQNWINIFTQVAKTGEAVKMESYISELSRWYSISFSLMREINNSCVALIFDDITKRKISEVHLEINNQKINEILNNINVLQNITAQKETEKKLKENMDLLQSILDISINSLSVLKSVRNSHNEIIDFEYILVNKTVVESLQKGILTGRLYTEVYPNAKESGWFDILKEVVESSSMADFEKPFNLYGKEDWFHVVAQKFDDGVIVTSSKITQRKEAEEEIREQSHFNRQITDTSPDILYVFDLVEEKIVYINKSIYYSLGYSPEDIYAMEDKLTKTLFHPKDYNRRIAHIVSMATVKPGEVRDMELRLKDIKGKWHWYNIRETFFKAGEDGSTKQILGIGQDITDKKEVQAAFKEEKTRNEELRRINELMDTFVYAAAHDLKAPVANLKLVTEVINNTEETALRLQLQNKYPAIIKTLDNTISGLINVLAIEKGSCTTLKELYFHDVYKVVIKELGQEVLEVNPKFTLDFSNCESIVYIESYLISVFRNMISNSLKYRSQEKKLTIHIESKRSGKYILLTFRDNGIGIDLGYYGKDLFKPFKRFHTLSEGSGIGLHLIKNMVTKNGGKIEVESKIGAGSIFKNYLVQYNK